MDDYIVRLGGAPTTAPPAAPTTAAGIRAAASRSTPQAPPRSAWRRWRGPMVMAGLALLVFANRGALMDVVDRVMDEAKKPVQSLNGEAELRKATAHFSSLYGQQSSYLSDDDTLARAVPDVHWGEVIDVETCFEGEGVVLVASTVRGEVSRLLVRGDDVGDVAGSQGCPADPRDIRPWVR